MIYRIVISVYAMVLFCGVNSAQNTARFSQYMFDEMSINPACTGKNSYSEIALAYRNQWLDMPGAPKSLSMSYQMPVRKRKIGLGASFFNDKLGIITNSEFTLFYSYQIKIANSGLFFGLSTGAINRQVRWDKITTTQPNDPDFAFGNLNFWAINSGIGIYFMSPGLVMGLSVPKLFADEYPPDAKTFETSRVSAKNWHYYFTMGYTIKVTYNIDIKPSFLIKSMRAAPKQYDYDITMLFRKQFLVGLGLHTKDSWVCMAGFSPVTNLMVNYAFDFSTAKISQYFDSSHEIIIRYSFKKNKQNLVSPRSF